MQRAKQRSIKKMNGPYIVYFQSHFCNVIRKAYLVVLALIYTVIRILFLFYENRNMLWHLQMFFLSV